MKRKSSSSILWGITAIILLIASVILLLCPSVSKELYQRKANETIKEFNTAVEQINQEMNINEVAKEDKSVKVTNDNDSDSTNNSAFMVNSSDYSLTASDIEALWRDSKSYNNVLKKHQNFCDSDFSSAALDLSDYGILNGVYGYISIPDIHLQMPILLGSSDENMAIGVTHLFSTSLPTGGSDTNCVISGHTGFTGKTFFDDIPKLTIGSIITVTTFFGELKYEVSDIKRIETTQIEDLIIQKGKDKLTLLTCADGGIKRWQVSCDRKSG